MTLYYVITSSPGVLPKKTTENSTFFLHLSGNSSRGVEWSLVQMREAVESPLVRDEERRMRGGGWEREWGKVGIWVEGIQDRVMIVVAPNLKLSDGF